MVCNHQLILKALSTFMADVAIIFKICVYFHILFENLVFQNKVDGKSITIGIQPFTIKRWLETVL